MTGFDRLFKVATLSLLLLVNAGLVWAAGSAGTAVELSESVKKHDTKAVRVLLQRHADVNDPEPDGTTPLHWAAYMDDLEAAKLLIGAGANAKTANRHGVTPISLACLNGNAALIELLLKAGADPETKLQLGETLLMTASRTGKADAVKVLLAHGANANAKEEFRGQTALMWAAADGHAEVIKALLKAGADLSVRSSGGLTALLFAVREGKIDAVRALLQAGADVNETTLPYRTRRRPAGQADTGEPAGYTSALVLAVANANFELASLLLEHGADPNAGAQGWTALHQITWVRNPGYGDNRPAPQGAGNVTSLDFVRQLLMHGADVNARMTKKAEMGSTDLNNVGATAFLLSARAGDAEMMRLLLSLGADPLLPNADNTTPVMAAAGVGTHSAGEDAGTESEALEALKLAVELGGDVNTVDNNGDTAMHGAAYKDLPQVVRFLAEKGARIEIWNQKNTKGHTPLMIGEGIQRGMNIRSSLAALPAIRELMKVVAASR